MTLAEKATGNGQEPVVLAEEEEDEEYEDYKKYAEEKEAATNNGKVSSTPADLEFSYVVKQVVEESVIKHGAHISIADNEPYAPEESLRSYIIPYA